MKDILVVYFSRSGYTRRIASEIARLAAADVAEIREARSRSGLRGYLRSALEAWRRHPVAIEADALDPRDYATVVVGSPVWAGNLSSPVRAYLARHRGDFSRVALFCTQGGSGASKVLDQMASLCGCTPVAAEFFNDSEIDRDRHAAKREAFVAALEQTR